MLRFDPGWLAGHTPPALEGPRPVDRTLALSNRLLDIEQRTMELRAENTRLRSERDTAIRSGGGSGGGWFDIPRTPHTWRLAGDSELDEESLDKYERRVDDPVVLEGRRGEAFLSGYGLLGEQPDYEGAVTALNAAKRCLDIVQPAEERAPDVSIVVPVYGQLGYTLNCIDSLIRHASAYSAEIIVVDDNSPDDSSTWLPRLQPIRYRLQAVNGGFIRSCNDGAALARGRYVLMLNNDTRVVEGWLDGLLDSFAVFPGAGLVGSKLCYADGSLQEAGGIVWRDGTTWNYGRNDDPNRPYYSYARQVDYISGCSIALTTELWRTLDGFDRFYTPAYCEDVDLCLKVVASGREVWYQPGSRIIHYEGKTSGTDTRTGVKAYQVINTRKLFLRWRERLELHRPNGEASYFERERKVRRRMLVVDVTTPTPKEDAGSVQTVLGLQVCRDAGYKVHFVPGDNWLFQHGHTTDLQRIGIECAYAPYDLGFDAFIRRFGGLFDVVMVYRMDLLERFIDDIRAHAPQAALLFHLADLHYLRRQREAELEGTAEALAEAEIVKGRELALVIASDCTITHSTIEAEILARELPEATVAVWPLMLELMGTAVPFSKRKDVCFLGGYRHPPNADAVRYFVHDILPLIRAQDPSIRFLVAGANPTREVLDMASAEGVEVLGMVDDLRDLFDRVRVFVCPLRFGAGVKGKIMSALSYGVPIVSTSIGVEGSGLVPGSHTLVADNREDFASRTLELYRDQTLWERLSKAGQKLLQEDFSLQMGRDRLTQAVEQAYRAKFKIQGVT